MKSSLVLISLLIICSSCQSVNLYLEADTPVFTHNAYINHSYHDSLTVITYNIEYGLHIKEVCHWLGQQHNNQLTRLIFLQEVSEQDVELMSNELSLNYVYYPISYEKKYMKNFGNAILSDLSILENQKILLDHKKPFNGRRRSATYAKLKIGEHMLHTYCLHLETMIMSPKLRKAQLSSLNNHMTTIKDQDKIIVAGDFNCISYDMRVAYRNILKNTDLLEYTQHISPSLHLFMGVTARTDLIFGKGFNPTLSQVHHHEGWSDHSAIEVKLVNQ